jgi:hypothetical protein
MDNGKYDQPSTPAPNGNLAVQLRRAGQVLASVTNKVTYTGLPKSAHTVTVFLVRNNHVNCEPCTRTPWWGSLRSSAARSAVTLWPVAAFVARTHAGRR